jgi:uncharacterized membrane protein
MTSKTSHFSPKHPRYLIFLFVIILALSILFRLINIEQKAYWDDEAFTSLRVSGYTETELVDYVANVDIISVKDLEKYQRINLDKGLIDTVKSLALEDPQHPPIYYVLTWFWVGWFGSSVAAFRSLSALISLLALPCIYWLCRELFDLSLTGWLAVALIGLSPFHVLYAQEAREYSLWTVTILLSSISLLRAIRINSPCPWLIYGVNVALSLYTFPSSAIVIVSHGVYLITIQDWRWSRKIINYLLAASAGFIAFIPWLVIIITNLNHINQIVGGQGSISIVSLVKIWAVNLSRIFFDINYEKTSINFTWGNLWIHLIQTSIVILLVSISGYAIYFLCQNTAKQVWLFILSLIFLTSLPVICRDLIYGSAMSTISRYFTPSYLGIHISVAYLLARGITSTSWQQKFWRIVMCTIFSGTIFSGIVSSQANYWWTKSHSNINFQAAELINQVNRPLVLSDASMGMLLGLSHQLNPQVQLKLKPYCHTCRIIPPAVGKKHLLPVPDNFDVFLFTPSPALLQEVEQDTQYQIELVNVDLWQLIKAPVIQ